VPVAEWRAWWASLDDDARRVYGVQPMLTDEGFARVIDYCENDVVILAEAWPRLSEWLDVDADAERVDAAVNDRGVWFDRDLARALIAHDARIGEQACDVAAAALGWTADRVRAAANSPAQFCAATGSSDAQALTVETLDHPLARAREALASIARGKLEAGLRLANDDGRLRDSHRYYGGHTGRWSGQGVQTQNMPRPAKHLEDVDTDALADAVLAGDVADADIDADVVSLLVRAAIAAAPGYELACADFAQVEGRASAWFAGDEDAVRVYTSGADPYTIAAEHIAAVCPMPAGVKPRQIGKCAELALGYGGGPGAFAKIAQGNRVDLSAFSGADRRRIVDAWRDLHAPIVRFWYAAEAAMRKAIDGRPAWCKAFQFVPGGADVACFLPSGRPIVYNGIRLSPQEGRKPRITYLPAGEDEQRAAPYCPDCMRRLAPTKFCGCGAELRGQSCPQHGKPATSYRMCPQHGLVEAALRADVYGGKLVENMVQAYCRDLMADALVRTEAAGLRPVMHVHDEIVCEVPEGTGQEALAELLHVMSTLPAWAAGFPIGADGWHGRRYRK
jgi:DNA polymerase